MANHLAQEALRKLQSVLFEHGEKGDEGLRHDTTILDHEGHFRPQWREDAIRIGKDTNGTWLPGTHGKLAICREMIAHNEAFRKAVLEQADLDHVAQHRPGDSIGRA